MLERKKLSQEELVKLIDAVPGMVYQFKMSPEQEFSFEFVSEGIRFFREDIDQSRDSFQFFMDIFHADDLHDFVPSVLESAKNLTQWQMDFRYLHPQRGTCWIRAVSQPERLSDGSVLWNGFLWDSTEQKNLEFSLKEAIEARDSFLSVASHELKTPTTVLLLKLQMLKRKYRDEDLSSDINEAITQIYRLNRQIDNLFVSSLPMEEVIPYEKESYNLSDFIRELHESLKSEIFGQGMKFEINLEEKIISNISRIKIGQVINNLVSNAIKYAPNSKLSVSLIQKDENLELIVSDTGPGIPKDQLGKVFDRYQKVCNQYSISGLGLGLYVTKNIIEQMNGTIQVSSELGTGTTFTIQVPKYLSLVSGEK